MISNFTANVELLRSVAPGSRVSVVRSAVGRRVRLRLTSTRAGVAAGQINAVQLMFGTRQANRFFWIAVGNDLSLANVQCRLETLAEHHPDDVAHFVRECIERTSDPVTIAVLARHPLSADLFCAWLEDAESLDWSTLSDRLRGDRLLGGSMAGAAKLLLEPARAVEFINRVTDLYQIPDSRLFQFMDSMGRRLGGDPAPNVVTAQVRHRLILAESFSDPSAFVSLLSGADNVTLVATSETFGRADFSSYEDWPNVGKITVEHIRSRVTRFSQDYVDLHDATAALATSVADAVAEIPDLLDSDDLPVLAVEIADFLFFQALKHRALDELLGDEGFDHVVVAVADQRRASEFLSLVSRVDGLLCDPRLELASISRSAGSRSRFWDVIDELRSPTPQDRSATTTVADSLITRKFDEDARRLADGMGSFVAGARPQVCLITANNGAYNDSTAGYVLDLRQDFDVRVMQLGAAVGPLFVHLDAIDPDHDVPVDRLAPSNERFVPLADLIQDQLCVRIDDASATRADVPARSALVSSLPRLAREVIAPSLGRLRTVQHWMQSMVDADTAPDVLVLTPQRNVAVGGIAYAARRFGIPTVVLEPHAQDASYSRYIKIASDYYGVMSDYFKTRSAEGFAIAEDRIETVGSPRQVAPRGYDPIGAQRAARVRYEDDHGVRFDDDVTHLVFFCQPSDWSHVSKVWSDVLEAAHRTGSMVLLKTHPEESVSRTAQYLDVAAAHGAADRVVLLEGDASMAIDLGDIVLTAYSAAGIDAALRQKPVVCVTVGDLRYPVDLPAILDASLTGSVDELVELVESFQADPAPLLARARLLLEREAQFVTGPGPRARALVGRAIAAGRDGIRDRSDVPDSLFLDVPHPTFPV